jgi:hypothetical protein
MIVWLPKNVSCVCPFLQPQDTFFVYFAIFGLQFEICKFQLPIQGGGLMA